VIEEPVQIRSRIAIRIRNGGHPARGDELTPRDRYRHVLELAPEHLLVADVVVAGHEYHGGQHRLRGGVRRMVNVHRQRPRFGCAIDVIPFHDSAFHARDSVDGALHREMVDGLIAHDVLL